MIARLLNLTWVFMLLAILAVGGGTAVLPEMQPPVAEGTIRLYDDGGRRTLIMDGSLPSFTAQVTPQS